MNILDKIKNYFKVLKQKKELRSWILDISRNGFFSDEEMGQIGVRCKELNIAIGDLKDIRDQAFENGLMKVISKETVTEKEADNLKKIKNYLQIPEEEIKDQLGVLQRHLTISNIKNGDVPTVLVANLILQKNEKAYWRESGNLMEERVVGRRYEGGSSGVSFRVARGISYRVGSQRGRLISDKAVLAVSGGELVITNKRAIFRGTAKSFELKLDKVLDVTFLDDGIAFTSNSKAKPYVVQYEHPDNGVIVKAIYNHAISEFNNS